MLNYGSHKMRTKYKEKRKEEEGWLSCPTVETVGYFLSPALQALDGMDMMDSMDGHGHCKTSFAPMGLERYRSFFFVGSHPRLCFLLPLWG
jgi:hypothetical protein